MSEDSAYILNAISYHKWKIYGVNCRFFGVMHIRNEGEFDKDYTCSKEGGQQLIDYIKEKIIENKDIEGILDIYTENSEWKHNKIAGRKESDEKYSSNRDILHQLLIQFEPCYFENKQDEDFAAKCQFYLKNNKEINARFQHIDIRNRHPLHREGSISAINFYQLKNMTLLNITDLIFVIDILKNYLNAIVTDQEFNPEIYEQILSKDRMPYKFIVNNILFKSLNYCLFGQDKDCSKLSKNFNKLKNHEIYNIIIDFYNDEFAKADIFLNDVFEKLKEDRNYYVNNFDSDKKFEDVVSLAVCFQMDLYFLGRFFNNILINPEKSNKTIVVTGDSHDELYYNFLRFARKKMKEKNPASRDIQYIERLSREYRDDNCV